MKAIELIRKIAQDPTTTVRAAQLLNVLASNVPEAQLKAALMESIFAEDLEA